MKKLPAATPAHVPVPLASVMLTVPAPHGAGETPISAVLSHGGVHVGLDTPLSALAVLMLDRGLSSAAVSNDIGAVVGVVSATDLLAVSQSEHLAEATAFELMHGPATMLPETASLATAAALMALERAHELPIACSRCESICVLSVHDILGWLGQQTGLGEQPGHGPRAADLERSLSGGQGPSF